MSTTPLWSKGLAALALVASTALSACNICGNPEQRVLNLSSGLDSVTVVRAGRTFRVGSVVRVFEPQASSPSFDVVFNTLEGATNGEAIVLNVTGRDPATDEVVILAVAVPVSLRQGEEYTVGSAFSVDASIDGDPRTFGAYDLQQPTRAEAAFTIAKYTFPPPLFTTNYRGATASGTVRVSKRERGLLELVVNLNFVDAAGNTAKVTGGLRASTERYTAPCST
jgi:hypothetical protein